MTWLKKSEPTEAWEIEDEGKIGDLKLASQIRKICNSVADSAEAVSVLYYGPSTETKKREIDRYERAKKRAEKNIERILDELLRDTAIYQVLNFCMKARDVENAERLFQTMGVQPAAGLPVQLFRGRGCTDCKNSGYRGRSGIHELMVIDERFHDPIMHRAGAPEYLRLAKERGMRTMFEDGVVKAMMGITTLEELFKATQLG